MIPLHEWTMLLTDYMSAVSFHEILAGRPWGSLKQCKLPPLSLVTLHHYVLKTLHTFAAEHRETNLKLTGKLLSWPTFTVPEGVM